MKSKVASIIIITLLSISNVIFSQTTIVPIQLAGKLILVEGIIDGEKGNFILDTGASGLVLNQKYFDGFKESDLKAYGVGGNLSKLQISFANLQIGELSWKNRKSIVTPLEHLEQAKGKQILGLIGGELFNNCELTIDFRNMEIQITRFDKKNKSRNWGTKSSAVVLPCKFKGSMPSIEVSINGVVYKFGLDTAAETNLMNARSRKKLKNVLSREKTALVRGVANQIKKVHSAKMDQIEVGDLKCGLMKTLFIDLNAINQSTRGARIDGIMGFELLRQFKVAINFEDRNISLWPYHSSSKDLVAINK